MRKGVERMTPKNTLCKGREPHYLRKSISKNYCACKEVLLKINPNYKCDPCRKRERGEII